MDRETLGRRTPPYARRPAAASGMTMDQDDSAATSDRLGDQAIAVALKYDLSPAALPKVVASGRGALAEAILALAFAAGVRVRADTDLAELLSVVDVGEDIPTEAIIAVAEVLAYVYRANGRLAELQAENGR